MRPSSHPPAPYWKLITTALDALPGLGQWLLRSTRQHRELERMIRESLMTAICPQGALNPRSAPEVVAAVERVLDHAHRDTRRARLPRLLSQALRLATFGGIWRTAPELDVDGPGLFEIFAREITAAFDHPEPYKLLGNVSCGGTTPTVDNVVARFRRELERLVRTGPRSRFRGRLLQIVDNQERLKARYERQRWRMAVKDALYALAPGAVTYGVFDAFWTNSPHAALHGLIAAGGVGAVRWLRNGGSPGFASRPSLS